MMPKSERASRLATRKAHRPDAAVTRHTGNAGKSWVAGDRASNPRHFGSRKTYANWNLIEDGKSAAARATTTRIREGEGAK